MLKTPFWCPFLLVLAAFAATPISAQLVPCQIEVVEKGSGWPVPLVELRTTHNVRFVTDNAGKIAFDLPELMGQETWFNLLGHGYEVKRDGFGSRGVRLTPESGKTLRVEVDRTIIAKRLGRLTGGGIFAESQKLGLEKNWQESGALGCDTVQKAVHRGRLFWAWGDTILAHYPLGLFDMTGATTGLQPLTSFEPPLRLKFEHHVDGKGKPRVIAKMPGKGPTWLYGQISLPDQTGTNRLVGTYEKIEGHLTAYEMGQAVWDDEAAEYRHLRVIWRRTDNDKKPPLATKGHPVLWTDEGGKRWVLFGNPLPHLRCPATFEAWQDEKAWEKLTPQETLSAASDGKPVKPHTGSIAWNPWRKRWVTVFMEHFGKPSAFGELWYAEANSPLGPWGPAVKVLSHEDYTFYNPLIHTELTPEGSPILLFEGTYTREFSGNKQPTPRYDYNQVLYRLDLDDPALAPAQKH